MLWNSNDEGGLIREFRGKLSKFHRDRLREMDGLFGKPAGLGELVGRCRFIERCPNQVKAWRVVERKDGDGRDVEKQESIGVPAKQGKKEEEKSVSEKQGL